MTVAASKSVLRPPARADAIVLLRGLSGELALLGVTGLYLFGSVARGDDDENSDLDIAVQTVDRADWMIDADVRDLVAACVGRSVDVALWPLPERLAEAAGDDPVKVF